MNAYKHLPCPRCKSTTHGYITLSDHKGGIPTGIRVYCLECGLEGPSATDKERADKNWNIFVRQEEEKKDKDEEKTVTIPSPKEIFKNANDHGWYDGIDSLYFSQAPIKDKLKYTEFFIPSKLALIHSEISECLEAYRKNGSPMPEDSIEPGEHSFTEELADAVIRIFDLCGFLNLDIAEAIRRKHEFNKSRPYRHGGKVV